MQPPDVAADPALLDRFIDEFAFDGLCRTERERRFLAESTSLVAIAWLWPDRTYAPDFDPFDPAVVRPAADPSRWSERLAAAFKHTLIATAQACERDVAQLLTHLAWTLRIGQGELARIVDGAHHAEHAHRLCNALHLEFDDGWGVRDPEHLARRIDQSELASRLSDQLRHLTMENLNNLVKHNKLPQGVAEPVRRDEPTFYAAPRPGDRYWAMYAAFVDDRRDRSRYSLADLNRILGEAGEEALPVEATTDPTWWIAADSDPEHTPASSWRGAGFRLAPRDSLLITKYHTQTVELPNGDFASVRRDADPEDPNAKLEVLDVTFQALPGRTEWLADPARLRKGGYRMPSYVPIPVRRDTMVDEFPAPAELASSTQQQASLAPDLDRLVCHLQDAGEADAATVKGFFPELAPADFTKLLARARRARQPHVRNHGSRTRPRWVAAGSKGDHLIPIARELWFRDPAEPVPHVGPGDELPDWFTESVQSTVGDEATLVDNYGADLAHEARAVFAALERLNASVGHQGVTVASEVRTSLERLHGAVDDLITIRLLQVRPGGETPTNDKRLE